MAIAVPQLALSAAMTATALLESAFSPERARVVVGYLGIASVVVQALAGAAQLTRRAATYGARRRALLMLRNDVQLALTHDLTRGEIVRLSARIAHSYYDDEDDKCTAARAHDESSSAVGASSGAPLSVSTA